MLKKHLRENFGSRAVSQHQTAFNTVLNNIALGVGLILKQVFPRREFAASIGDLVSFLCLVDFWVLKHFRFGCTATRTIWQPRTMATTINLLNHELVLCSVSRVLRDQNVERQPGLKMTFSLFAQMDKLARFGSSNIHCLWDGHFCRSTLCRSTSRKAGAHVGETFSMSNYFDSQSLLPPHLSASNFIHSNKYFYLNSMKTEELQSKH